MYNPAEMQILFLILDESGSSGGDGIAWPNITPTNPNQGTSVIATSGTVVGVIS